MSKFDEPVCPNLDIAIHREWLETNGIGGFASSTITGLNTRRYHGLLVAATKPPVGRMVLLSKLEETLRSIRTVERAKLILMKARNIDESEAYSYLRDQAMRKRISIGSVASLVVESSNILLGSKD